MILTEFLLARIAEDERWAGMAQAAHDREHETGWAFVATVAQPPVASAARVLAECEAKRRIVEHAEVSAQRARIGPAPGDGAWFLTCRYLALPYADHPDYREEWAL